MKCISIENLTFYYDNIKFFENLNLELYEKKCYVLSGLNGTGKSTLLKIISGKTLAPYDSVKVYNKDPFRDTSINKEIVYITNEWGTRTVAYCGYNMPMQSSIKVKEMMIKLKKTYPERNKELISILEINEEWSLNEISEGQRKRVQLYLGLIQPFKVCLLDEITVNLDLLIKDKFMNYLKKECIERSACILYVTHIFDGLDNWCDDLIYLNHKKHFEIIPIHKIPNSNLFSFLLLKFKEENFHNDETMIKPSMKNAGGYSDGVLINY